MSARGSLTTVRAVVVSSADGEAPPGRTRDSLGRQTRLPDDTVTVPERSSGVPADDVDWIWLLDEGVLPEPGALEAFAEALARSEGLGAPVLLAGKVVGPDGSLDPHSQPFPMVRDPDLVAAAFERRLAPVRLARAGSVLVQAQALRASGGSGADPLVWSAQLLATRLGLLVPTSVAIRPSRTGRPVVGARAWLELLAGGTLEYRDRAYLGLRFAESASAGLRTRIGSRKGP